MRIRKIKSFLQTRQHPIKLISYTSKNLWLMLIPLGKYLIATKFDIRSWIRANWVDILVISGIIAIAVLKWIFIYFEIDEDGIISHSGLFGISTTKVYYSEITTLSITQNYIYTAVRASTLYVETNADSVPKTDIKLVLSTKCVNEIFETVTKQCAGLPKYTIAPKKSYLVVFSLLFSSAISGMILYGTFMFEVYRLVGREMEQQLVKRANDGFSAIDSKFLRLTSTIPKAILILAGVVIGSLFLSFVTNLMRHWSFTATRCGSQYIINSGFATKRKHIINRDKINFIDIRQSLLMRVFKISTVILHCTGYGKSHREISALIPITTEKEMNNSLKILIPNAKKPKAELTTSSNDLPRFILVPILLCFLPSVSGMIAKLLISSWHTEINILMTVGIIPFLWLVLVQSRAAFCTSIGFDDNICSLTYCPAYSFHNVLIPKQNISKIKVIRNPMQKINGTCTIKIFSNAETVKVHTVKSLPFDEVRKILAREGYIIYKI